jgi:hypothetical protein
MVSGKDQPYRFTICLSVYQTESVRYGNSIQCIPTLVRTNIETYFDLQWGQTGRPLLGARGGAAI